MKEKKHYCSCCSCYTDHRSYECHTLDSYGRGGFSPTKKPCGKVSMATKLRSSLRAHRK